MKRLLAICNIHILLILLIGTGFASAENNNQQPYNENNFIPFLKEDGSYLTEAQRSSFSQDGKKLVYNHWDLENDREAIKVMDIEYNNSTIVYSNGTIDDSFTQPKFSPNGEKILFASFYWNKDHDKIETSIDVLIINGTKWDINCSRNEIYRINLTIGQLREPIYNYVGSKIAYRVYGRMFEGAADLGDIYIMDSDGTNHKRLTTDKGMDWSPSFSPDGSKIAWVNFDKGTSYTRIWIMNSDGSNKKFITPDFNYCDNPVFTPYGKILFECEKVSPHSNKVEEGNIWMIDADGSNPILIVPREFGGYIRSTYPSISPDNTMIVFDHGLSTGGLYYVKDPDGDGIWEDSDGDGVADVCDGAPNDPDEGYIKGNVSDGFIPDLNIIYSMILIAGVAIISKRKSK